MARFAINYQLNDTYILTQLIARVYDDLGTLSGALGELAELTRVNGWLKSALNMGFWVGFSPWGSRALPPLWGLMVSFLGWWKQWGIAPPAHL